MFGPPASSDRSTWLSRSFLITYVVLPSVLRDLVASLYALDREGSVVKKNIGASDRLVRLGIGTLFVAASIYVAWRINPWLGLVPLVIGVFLVYEAAIGWCALYALLGKNTCPVGAR